MVKEIREIETKKLLDDLAAIEQVKLEGEQLSKQLLETINLKKEELRRLSSQKRPNWFSKIFKTKKYTDFLLSEKSISTLQNEIEELQSQKQICDEKLKEYYSHQEEYEVRKSSIESLSTIADLRRIGYSFEDAIKLLMVSDIPVVLTESEKVEMFEERKEVLSYIYMESDINNSNFTSLKDFIMVHKTDYPPKGGKIHSRASGKVWHDCSITLGGEEYNFKCKSGRNTVHLSTNHEVSGNNGGDWSKMKYAVLIPFEDLKDNSDVASARAVDTYTRGPVTLTNNSYILCPKGESAIIQADNPGVTVIEYEGEYVQHYANMLIMGLGYKLELGHDYGFCDEKQANIHYDLMKDAGFKMDAHFWSEDKERETNLIIIYQAASIIQLINEKGLLNKMDREQLVQELKDNQFGEMLRAALGDDESKEILRKELAEVGISIDMSSLVEQGRPKEEEQIRYVFDNMTTVPVVGKADNEEIIA